jgi:hypothetical protein
VKIKKLGLSKKRGEVYIVRDDGKVIATINGKAVQVARAKLVDREDFLYYIDDDGDLARDYKSRRKTTAYASRPSATKPASAKLQTRALYDTIEELLFPADSVNLCNAGFIEESRANVAARKVYEKEFKRLAAEITRALGPPTKVPRYGEPGLAWELRGRWIRLSLVSEDKEFPASIDLSTYDPATDVDDDGEMEDEMEDA